MSLHSDIAFIAKCFRVKLEDKSVHPFKYGSHQLLLDIGEIREKATYMTCQFIAERTASFKGYHLPHSYYEELDRLRALQNQDWQ